MRRAIDHGESMATSVKCPNCGATFLAGRANSSGSLTCPECDTSFKTRGTSPSGAGDKSQKPRSAAPEERGSAARMSPLVLAAIGGGALLLLVVLGFVFLRGKRDGGKPAGQQAVQPAVPFDAAKFAVVDAPLPESELPDPEPQPKPAVTAPSPADAAGTSPKKALTDATEPSAVDSSKPVWDVAPDVPAALPEPVAEDLQLAVTADGYERSVFERFPVLAGLNGPWALATTVRVEETAEKTPARPESSKKKKPARPTRTKKPAAGNSPPAVAQPTAKVDRWRTPLIDLRTGKEAGTFWS